MGIYRGLNGVRLTLRQVLRLPVVPSPRRTRQTRTRVAVPCKGHVLVCIGHLSALLLASCAFKVRRLVALKLPAAEVRVSRHVVPPLLAPLLSRVPRHGYRLRVRESLCRPIISSSGPRRNPPSVSTSRHSLSSYLSKSRIGRTGGFVRLLVQTHPKLFSVSRFHPACSSPPFFQTADTRIAPGKPCASLHKIRNSPRSSASRI